MEKKITKVLTGCPGMSDCSRSVFISGGRNDSACLKSCLLVSSQFLHDGWTSAVVFWLHDFVQDLWCAESSALYSLGL